MRKCPDGRGQTCPADLVCTACGEKKRGKPEVRRVALTALAEIMSVKPCVDLAAKDIAVSAALLSTNGDVIAAASLLGLLPTDMLASIIRLL